MKLSDPIVDLRGKSRALGRSFGRNGRAGSPPHAPDLVGPGENRVVVELRVARQADAAPVLDQRLYDPGRRDRPLVRPRADQAAVSETASSASRYGPSLMARPSTMSMLSNSARRRASS